MMYHIGICDDDFIFIKYIERLFQELQEDIVFYEYLSGEELVFDMQRQKIYDLLILDIHMPGMDGNKAAKKFREQFPNTLLVFCSGVYLPTVESFEATPYRYWLKEYTEDKMKQEIKQVLSKMEKSKVMPYIIGKKANQFVRLSAAEIFYIAIAKKGTVIYCGNKEQKYTSSKRLMEFFDLLKEFGFAYAHNSYIVNLKYVAIVNLKELEFVNGEKLTVSRSRAKEFMRAFAISLARKYEE